MIGDDHDESVASSRTVGVDLASQPAKTAMCTIDWSARGAVIRAETGATDERIIAVALTGDKVGFDCPFGWPVDFIEAVKAHQRCADWPTTAQSDVERTRSLRYRQTDRVVARLVQGRWPLSVSSDLIGVVAMRYARLETQLRGAGCDVSRDGSGLVAETYPAAALRHWGMSSRGYKSADATALLSTGVDELLATVDGLRFADDASEQLCRASHDAFDSVLCALVARAVIVGETIRPADNHERHLAQVEGWVHVPTCELGALS